MSWARGSMILTDIVSVISENVTSDDAKYQIYDQLIDIFESADCDTIDECLEIDDVFDEVYYDKYPEEDEPEEDEDTDY